MGDVVHLVVLRLIVVILFAPRHDRIIPVRCRREQDFRPGQTQEDTGTRQKQEQGTEPDGPASRVVADEDARGWPLRGRGRGAAPAGQERSQPGQRSRLPPGRGPVVGEVARHHVGRAAHGPGVGPGSRAGAGWVWRLGLALGLGLIGHGLVWGVSLMTMTMTMTMYC